MKQTIGVMSFSENPGAQSYFLAVDDRRVVFFSRLMLVAALPYATFTVIRNGEVVDSGSTGFGAGNPGGIEVTGLDHIRESYETRIGSSERNWSQTIKTMPSFYFLPGDLIEIDWAADQENLQNWLSRVATNRFYGAAFETVFANRKDFIDPILRTIGYGCEELTGKNVIFTDLPFDDNDLQQYY